MDEYFDSLDKSINDLNTTLVKQNENRKKYNLNTSDVDYDGSDDNPQDNTDEFDSSFISNKNQLSNNDEILQNLNNEEVFTEDFNTTEITEETQQDYSNDMEDLCEIEDTEFDDCMIEAIDDLDDFDTDCEDSNGEDA